MQNSVLKQYEDRKTVALVNHRLAMIQQLLPKLPLNGVELRVAHIHMGLGIWPQNRHIGFHQHPDLQIEYIVHGKADFFFEQDQITLGKGQSMVIPPGTSHHWLCRQKLVMMGLVLAASGPQCIKFMNGLEEAEGPLIDAGAEESGFNDLFLALARPQEEVWQTEISAGIFLGWLCSMLGRVLPLEQWKENIDRVLLKEDRAMALVNQATRFIEANYTKPIKTDDIALHVGLGVRQLNRLFKELTGASPIQALQNTRLNKAMAMLCAHPDYSIKAVAYDCGFHSHSYFTRCFMNAFGVLPSSVQENE